MKEKEFNEFLLKNNIAISDNRKDSSSFDTDKALNSIRFFSFPYKSLFESYQYTSSVNVNENIISKLYNLLILLFNSFFKSSINLLTCGASNDFID